MTDDPTTQDLDDAGYAMQAFEDELRALSPSRMTPEQQSMYFDRMRAAEHRERFRRTGMTYRDACRCRQGSMDDGFLLLAAEQRYPVRSFLRRTLWRWPWLTLLVGCWLTLYGLAKLCIWILLHF